MSRNPAPAQPIVVHDPASSRAAMTAHPRVLVMAEGVTLAHVGRAIELASWLHRDGGEVVLACDPRYRRFTAALPFPVRAIESLAPERFLAALARGRAVFSESYIAQCVEQDLALLRDVQPGVVIGDFRLSLQVSARLARVPYANVTNAYWSPYARPRFRMPAIALTRHVRPIVGDALFRLVRPFAFAAHARPMNRVRRRYGLAPLRGDVRKVYCDGDATLYADLQQLVPVSDAPAGHRYIGPVLWSPPLPAPPWLDPMMAGDAPVFVTLGSSGAADVVARVVDVVHGMGRPVTVATAGRTALASRPGVWVADFLPVDTIMAAARLVVCNGGSPLAYHALAHGLPVVGVASNLDQLLNMDYVERAGAGILVRADRATPRRLRAAIERAIGDPALAEGARRMGSLIRKAHGAHAVRSAVMELVHCSEQLTDDRRGLSSPQRV
jgi:UDP:flavonoid glycosyltransferase YjiC (YdhE family)